MKFLSTGIEGAYLLELEKNEDERGFFARTWSAAEFRAHGLSAELSECSISFNPVCGTLRGMHYQVAPYEETKLVMCVQGLVFDAIVDLRKGSRTYLQCFSTELSLDNARLLYVPPGVAHGFLTLLRDSFVHYQIGGCYVADAARGVRWNDPQLAIEWPAQPTLMSARDRGFDDYTS